MRMFTDMDLLELAEAEYLVAVITKMDGTESFPIVAPNANTQNVIGFARRLLAATHGETAQDDPA